MRRIYLDESLPGLLKARGWTQQRLADEADMKRTDVNAIVRGRISVGPDRLARIAAALEVSEEALAPTAGRPSEAPDGHLEELAAAGARLSENQARILRELATIRKRLERLEAQAEQRADAPSGRRGAGGR